MAIIKSYTDLEQSKKLAEILPIETADMSWVSNGLGKPFARTIPIKGDPEELCSCWSLAALLRVIPMVSLEEYNGCWNCVSYNKETHAHIFCKMTDDSVDACYEMILKLHELKIL